MFEIVLNASAMFNHANRRDELVEAFRGWRVVFSRADTRPAPGHTWKVFDTVVAERS